MSSHLRLCLPEGLFPVGLPVKILKALLPFSILATCPAHLNLLDMGVVMDSTIVHKLTPDSRSDPGNIFALNITENHI